MIRTVKYTGHKYSIEDVDGIYYVTVDDKIVGKARALRDAECIAEVHLEQAGCRLWTAMMIGGGR